STAQIIEVMSQVCAALSASHDQEIVHRDVKPENIVLVPKRGDDGSVRAVVKVCDFGIAQDPDAARITGAAAVCGTPDYMAPEQPLGQPVDARADIYACGVVMYEMITGGVPFGHFTDARQIAEAQVKETPERPSARNPEIDRRLEALILKAM